MEKKKVKAAAPMPRNEEDIRNSMKLYAYLVCISGLAVYPENTRMFRQKNLIPSKIKEILGLDPKTTKKYLYQLEKEGLISYEGETPAKRIDLDEIEKEIKEEIENGKIKQLSEKAFQSEITNRACIQLWNIRNKKEKDGVYYIPRPNKWTPIPEITLETLNEKFKCSELELKLYILCSSYRDECVERNRKIKSLSFEGIKDVLQIKRVGSDSNRDIRGALFFLKGLGLIDFAETLTPNMHGKAIPSFKIYEVNYYINYKIEIDEENDDDLLLEIKNRIQDIIDETVNS